jgi:heme oxygenase
MTVQQRALRAQLKGATSPFHEALEALPCQKILLSDQCSVQDYSYVLQRYAQAIARVDSFLAGYDWPANSPYHPRLPLLNQDLQILFPSRPAIASTVMENSHFNPWGLRYVIEGMALGAQWMLNKSPIFKNSEVLNAANFFRYRQTHWPHFCDELELYAKGDSVQSSVIESACWMFQCFHFCLVNKLDYSNTVNLVCSGPDR